MNNMELWNKVKTPPQSALKKIKGGRLSGMTDISPQWRYEVLTEIFGPCGVGWKYEITNTWFEPGTDGQIVAFATVNLFSKCGESSHGVMWSEPTPGLGGSMLITKEKAGLRTNDEALKMAVTDALSVACKMLGIGADVYGGNMDGSKYRKPPANKRQPMGNDVPMHDAPTKKQVTRAAAEIVATYTSQIDKCEDLEALKQWWRDNYNNIKKDGVLDKVEAYKDQIKQVFST